MKDDTFLHDLITAWANSRWETDQLFDRLTAQGYHIVSEGQAVVDGQVVRLVRWSDSLFEVDRVSDGQERADPS